jgi:thioredoxin 1
MSETDDVDEIRERKRKELLERAGEESDADPNSAETPDEPVHVESQAHFEDLTGEGVVLADFYADWCGPCKQLEPIVERVAANTPATVAKVDVDAHQALAGEYGVRGVPTMVLFSDGEVAERIVGVRGEDQLASLVENYA